MQILKNEKIKSYLHLYFICLIISIVAYLPLIANELTNTYDGMWHGSYYTNYVWVYKIGRWFWPTIGGIRLDMSPEPFTSIVTIAITLLGTIIVCEWFEVNSKWKQYCIILLSVINTGMCIRLSYRFMSPTFAIAYLLSVLGIYVIRKNQSKWRFLISIICLTLSLGSYQMDLGCACLLILLNTIWLLRKEDSVKKIICFCVCSGFSILVSCTLYKIIWDYVLQINELDAADYLGANSVSFAKILIKLPESFINTYKISGDYFFTDTIKYNVYQEDIYFKEIIIFIFALFAGMGGIEVVKRKKIRLLPYALCIILIPAAVNVAMIISANTNSLSVQQTMPLAVLLPFLISMTNINKEGNIPKLRLGIYFAWLAMLMILLFGNFLMISVDQSIMRTSRENSLRFINRVIDDIDFEEQPLKGYVFIGKISDNPMYKKEKIWDMANSYARYGDFWLDGDCNTQSYIGLLRDVGVDLKINKDSRYWHEIEQNDDVKKMPVYPNEGYIKKIDDVIVIKLSEY